MYLKLLTEDEKKAVQKEIEKRRWRIHSACILITITNAMVWSLVSSFFLVEKYDCSTLLEFNGMNRTICKQIDDSSIIVVIIQWYSEESDVSSFVTFIEYIQVAVFCFCKVSFTLSFSIVLTFWRTFKWKISWYKLWCYYFIVCRKKNMKKKNIFTGMKWPGKIFNLRKNIRNLNVYKFMLLAGEFKRKSN